MILKGVFLAGFCVVVAAAGVCLVDRRTDGDADTDNGDVVADAGGVYRRVINEPSSVELYC